MAKPRRFGVVVLSLWLAGIGCLVGCCGAQALAAAPIEAGERTPASTACAHHAQSGEIEPSRTLASTTQPEPFAPVPRPRTMACCPLAGQPTVVTGKTCPDDGHSAVVETARFQPSQAQAIRTFVPPTAPNYIPDRGGTYLRCCVFLI